LIPIPKFRDARNPLLNENFEEEEENLKFSLPVEAQFSMSQY